MKAISHHDCNQRRENRRNNVTSLLETIRDGKHSRSDQSFYQENQSNNIAGKKIFILIMKTKNEMQNSNVEILRCWMLHITM